MKTTDYVPVDALKAHILNIREHYQGLLDTYVPYGSMPDKYFFQGALKALNELEEQIDEMKVSL